MDFRNEYKERSQLPEELFDQVWPLTSELVADDQMLARIAEEMGEEVKVGLSSDKQTRDMSSLVMQNTFVRLPLDSTDEGDCLAIDLGGTNYRLLHVRLVAGRLDSQSVKECVIPDKVLTGSVQQLFDWLAGSLGEFLSEQPLLQNPPTRIPLGFTFSFPIINDAIDSARLVTWTKNFRIQGGEGEDICQYFKDAINKRNLPIEIVAMLNDCTGTLLAGTYNHQDCLIGLVVGSGCNAAYMEQVVNIENWRGDSKHPQRVIVDPQFGGLGDNGSMSFAETSFSKAVDQLSNHPNSYKWEKQLSGQYLGETVRMVLMKLTGAGLMFSSMDHSALQQQYSFHTSYLSTCVADETDVLTDVAEVLEKINITSSTLNDRRLVKLLCHMISDRAARLLAATLSVLVRRTGSSQLTIAGDGSLYRRHPTIPATLKSTLHNMCPHIEINWTTANDGGGLGAAFATFVSVRMRQMDLYLGERHESK